METFDINIDQVELIESADLLHKLSHDSEEWIRESVAGNPHTRPKTLDRLARDDYFSVRSAVAENTNTWVKTLSFLSHDIEHVVRMSVAKNSRTSSRDLSRLSDDHVVKIRQIALSNRNVPKYAMDSALKSNCVKSWEGVASNIKADRDMLYWMAKNTDEREVLASIAENPNVQDDALNLISKIESTPYVLSAIARNLICSSDTIDNLIKNTRQPFVLATLSYKDNLTQSNIMGLVDKLNHIANDTATKINIMERIAKHLNCPAEIRDAWLIRTTLEQ